MEPELVLQPAQAGDTPASPRIRENLVHSTEDGPTLSPFLPNTNIQYAWDSTSLGYLKQCGRLYQYTMIDGWGEGDESIHLRFGIEFHTAMQEYDQAKADGLNHDASVFYVVEQLLHRTWEKDHPWTPDPDLKAAKYKNRHTLVRAVIWYLESYKDDPAQTYIMENGKPAVELSFRFELDWGPSAVEAFGSGKYTGQKDKFGKDEFVGERQPYLLCGHLDRVVNFQDHLFVMDYKTTTITPSAYYFNQFEPNNQMTLYTLASQVVMEAPIKGVIINAIQLLVDSSRTVRGFTYRTPQHLDEWLKDLERWLNLAEAYAEDNYWPMNDTACDKFGGCKFRTICSKAPSVREQFLKSSFKKLPESERWNPLKPR